MSVVAGRRWPLDVLLSRCFQWDTWISTSTSLTGLSTAQQLTALYTRLYSRCQRRANSVTKPHTLCPALVVCWQHPGSYVATYTSSK